MKNFNKIPGARSFLILSLAISFGCASPSENPVIDKGEAEDKVESKAITHEVVISKMNFSPETISIKKGDTVIFNNQDPVAHDITEEKTKAWTSSKLEPGQTWSLVVSESADYYCSLHQVMKGRILVE